MEEKESRKKRRNEEIKKNSHLLKTKRRYSAFVEMTSSSEARPSVRLALAEARAMRILAEPTSPSGTKRELSMPARHEEAKATTNGDDFFVTPVAVAIDRTGGHAAMREDILLPLDGKSRAERVSLWEHLIGN